MFVRIHLTLYPPFLACFASSLRHRFCAAATFVSARSMTGGYIRARRHTMGRRHVQAALGVHGRLPQQTAFGPLPHSHVSMSMLLRSIDCVLGTGR